MAAYRGRIAPTPSGHLHLGHGRTFWIAQQRAAQRGSQLLLRNEDLDLEHCKPQFAADMLTDLRWLGLRWDEGPDVGGPFAPYVQSQRLSHYHDVWRQLVARQVIYLCRHSRRDVQQALRAPHDEQQEMIFPPKLRPRDFDRNCSSPGETNWRFRVPDGRAISFVDQRMGPVSRTAGLDFGDFLVWRKDGFPSYELAVVADDCAMRISEVVRGEDLLTSTARQLLLYAALHESPPQFFHCPLLLDEQGRRMAKRSQSKSIRQLRAEGHNPAELVRPWAALM